MQIRDRVAIVTGASRGIGAALARELRLAGARLALTARGEDGLREVAAAEDLVVPGDLTDAGTRERIVRETIARFGRIDLLINNAGVGHYRTSIEAGGGEIRALWEINFFAPLELARLVVPQMLSQPRLPGAGEAGMVVNVSSIAGKVTLPWFTMYSASKYALCSWTSGLRMEYMGKGLRTLLVCPGYVKTEFQANVLSGEPPASLAASKERYAITPEQCARATCRAIRANRRTIVTPASNWALAVLGGVLPGMLEKRLAKINGSA